MKKKVKNILYGVLCLVMAAVWFFALKDWELLLFHVIPLNNVVAGILFAVFGVLSLIVAFAGKDKEDDNK